MISFETIIYLITSVTKTQHSAHTNKNSKTWKTPETLLPCIVLF